MEKKFCKKCNKQTIYNTICSSCHIAWLIKKTIGEVENNFRPKSEYNRYLFKLYLIYIKRSCPNFYQIAQIHDIKKILENRPIDTFKSWSDVYKESNIYRESFDRNKNVGCPFIKIGYILSELGAIAPRSEDRITCFEKSYQKFPLSCRDKVVRHIQYLINTRRKHTSIYKTLLALKLFNKWMLDNKESDLITANQQVIIEYLDELKSIGKANLTIRSVYSSLNFFYGWCVLNRMIIVNPCSKIVVNSAERKITVCSDKQIKQLFAFIKNSNSDHELALIITLILVWGVKLGDLRFIKVDCNVNNTIKLIFSRVSLGRKKHFNREQVLTLPNGPKWLLTLQKQFYVDWQQRHRRMGQSLSNNYLLFNKVTRPGPISIQSVRRRIEDATITATGSKIHAKILRQTCGNLHTTKSDASMLSRLGWSRQHSFSYTWIPKVIFTS